MKHPFLLVQALAAVILPLHAAVADKPSDADSLTITGDSLREVQVTARIEQPTGTYTEINGTDLNRTNTGQNLPFLLNMTPSLVATSDDGLGVGYTYFRIRGTDHTRINMTVNDVLLNDQESQTVFWVNMTDMASSLTSLDVQRGVGASSSASAPFGASVNMSTLDNHPDHETDRSHFEIGFNGGMYNTFREYAKADIRLANRWRAEARFSKMNSDGYLERAASDLYSYHGSIGYYGHQTKAALTVFGGKEKTYMAWDGVSWEDFKSRPRYNPAGKYKDDQGNTAYYPNQNDYYAQQHAQLRLSQTLTKRFFMDATLHYTHGGGYYEQYKAGKKFSDFGLLPYTDADGNEVKRSDFVREKHLNNHFYGGIVSVRYVSEPVEAQAGVTANNYHGQHFGNITYVRDSLYPYPLPYDYEYYRSTGKKTDANVYAKANWHLLHRSQERLTLYGDLQYRYVHYRINGINDEDLQPIPVNEHFHFFNPKAGLTYRNHGHQTWFHFAIANREPSRKNYTEAGVNETPRAERLYDYELGYKFTHRLFAIGLNLYFMDYDNQLVLTGRYSDTGAFLTKNVKDSYRTGAELTGGVQIQSWMRWDMNLTLSRNKILNYKDVVNYYDANYEWLHEEEKDFGTTTIAFSPSVTFGSLFTFDTHGFTGTLQTLVISRQYLDNSQNKTASLPAYTVSNVNLQYKLPLPNNCPNITLRCQINNLLNTSYVSNGGSDMAYFEDGTACWPWYYVQAGINVHAGFVIIW
jgi:iron complex outermembrane receptor protein